MIYIININNIKLDMINIFYNICENNNYDEIVFKLDKNIKYQDIKKFIFLGFEYEKDQISLPII